MDASTVKVIVLGDSGVGKSSLLNRYVNNTFSNLFRTTMGADYFTKHVKLNGEVVALQIWDTAGQERFQSLGTSFYRGADCCVLVFDLTRPTSFESLQRWRIEFLRQSSLPSTENFPFVVMGNKSDLSKERAIPRKRVADYCQEEPSTSYFEVSAKEAEGLEEAFGSVASLGQVFHSKNRARIALRNKIRLAAIESDKSARCWQCWT